MLRSIGVVLILAVGACFFGGCSGGGGGGGDPAEVQFASGLFQVNEDGTVVTAITLQRSGGNQGNAISVEVLVTDGTATNPADYTVAAPVIVSWPANDLTDKIVTVGPVGSGSSIEIVQDNIDEGSPGLGGADTVNLELINPNGTSIDPGSDTAVLEILDDDDAGTVQFTAATFSYVEDGFIFTAVMVERLGGTDGDITVNISSVDGTANSNPLSQVEPVDFDAIVTSVSFADGVGGSVTVTAVSAAIIDDLLPELDETFTVNITSTTGNAAIGSPSSAEVTILDNDDMLEIPSPTMAANGLFGSDCEKVGARLAIGCPGCDSGTGEVNLFDMAFGVLVDTFDEPLAIGFGKSLARDGSQLAVGASGALFVYTSDGFTVSPDWFVPSTQDGFADTGIALGDGRLVIGAPGAQIGGSLLPSGQVFVYDRNNGNLLQTLDGVADNRFGSAFTIFFNDLVIGSPGNTGFAAAYFGTPLFLDIVVPNPLPTPGEFGAALAGMGSTLIVGAPGEDGLLMDAGVVYYITAGVPQAFESPAPVAGGRFGQNIVVIGTHVCIQEEGGGGGAGIVYVLDAAGMVTQTILNPNPVAGADFGAAMCEFDGALVICAPGQGGLPPMGSVFVFKLL